MDWTRWPYLGALRCLLRQRLTSSGSADMIDPEPVAGGCVLSLPAVIDGQDLWTRPAVASSKPFLACCRKSTWRLMSG